MQLLQMLQPMKLQPIQQPMKLHPIQQPMKLQLIQQPMKLQPIQRPMKQLRIQQLLHTLATVIHPPRQMALLAILPFLANHWTGTLHWHIVRPMSTSLQHFLLLPLMTSIIVSWRKLILFSVSYRIVKYIHATQGTDHYQILNTICSSQAVFGWETLVQVLYMCCY